jgi:hypothetical protein
MSIFNELIERVSMGETFHIDFEKRTMRVGKTFLIKNGEYDTSKILANNPGEHCPIELILGTIDCLYERYKYSLPSERSEKKRRTYFKALPIEQIPDKELFIAERREVARARLEGLILCLILENKFVWNENVMGKWFYQSKEHQDLVILRKWIEKGE